MKILFKFNVVVTLLKCFWSIIGCISGGEVFKGEFEERRTRLIVFFNLCFFVKDVIWEVGVRGMDSL